ncbi:MAG: serine/threonine-protein kinase [Xenococcaceae cyanobacterium MO_188.B29]|nr:serine/threonine-protein kinase [Xenococcaceae cyanobacterium MO_188.B29]
MSNSAVNNNEIPFGTTIDNRYLIQKVLGQGGLGRTYLAFDTHRFNEPCVLKEFAPLGSGQYDLSKSRDLFKREAKILHQITHPQIPKFLACFEGKGRLFLVQEYVKGKTYSQILQERQQQGQVFAETEVVRWLMNMLPILTYIHQRGIIHRDISPDNIMQPQGEELPVLIDFGVGKLMNLPYADKGNQSGSHYHSFVGKMSFVGKIGYAPREQISMGRCSENSDLYALGVTALVLLTGKMPTLLLDYYTLEWQWHKYVQISPGLAQILDKMTEDIPMERYQSAQEVIDSLRELESNQEITLTPELTSHITDSHFYQKVAAFPGEDETHQEDYNYVSSVDEEATIAYGTNSGFADMPSQPQERQPWAEPPTNNSSSSKSRQFRSSQGIEDTIPVNSSASSHSQSTSRSQKKPVRSRIKPNPSPQQHNQSNSSIDKGALLGSMANISRQDMDTKFIKLCQQELAYIIGPMANLIVEEILVQYNPSSAEELVNALAEQIPDTHKAIQFKRKLLS